MKNADHIVMAYERLTISKRMIEVDYKFQNPTNRTMSEIVAFPLPTRPFVHPESNVAEVREFEVTVNGIPIKYQSQVRAFVGDKEVTDELKALGLSQQQIEHYLGYNYEPFGTSFSYNEDILDTVQRLKQAGFIYSDNIPAWGLQTTYWWKQEFRPGTTSIKHRYVPGTGHQWLSGGRNKMDANFYESFGKREGACIDKGTATTLSRLEPAINYSWVEYILTTARTWNGPIREFELILKKSSPDEILSLCFPGNATRVDATTILFRQRNFVPEHDLKVFFFASYKNP